MRGAALFALAALASCGSPKPATAPARDEPPAEPATIATPAPAPVATAAALRPVAPPADAAALESRDCRTVAQAYVAALARNDFATAARVWDDPVIDDARLKALFAGYTSPSIKIAGLQQEGAAGSSYCTVNGTLSDAGDPAKPVQKGAIVLKRVNDVPGATAEQLRWTIRSSTFVEKTERTG